MFVTARSLRDAMRLGRYSFISATMAEMRHAFPVCWKEAVVGGVEG